MDAVLVCLFLLYLSNTLTVYCFVCDEKSVAGMVGLSLSAFISTATLVVYLLDNYIE